jgi:hypothetical protein
MSPQIDLIADDESLSSVIAGAGYGQTSTTEIVPTRLVRVLVAEAIGTFALVFAGCGAIMVDAKTHELSHLGIGVGFGLSSGWCRCLLARDSISE